MESKKDDSGTIPKSSNRCIKTEYLFLNCPRNRVQFKAVVEALINSTAIKYSVRLNDIHSVNDTYNGLIQAIYETNFIPIDKKTSYRQSIK